MSAPIHHKSGEFRPGNRHEVSARSERSGGRLFYYVMVRVTGLMLAILVLGHFAITHITTDVAETDSSFIVRHWSSVLWLLWDWTMLAAAMLHGAAGVWISIDDYTPDPNRRRFRHRMLVVVSTVLLVLGTITIAVATLALGTNG